MKANWTISGNRNGKQATFERIGNRFFVNKCDGNCHSTENQKNARKLFLNYLK